MELLRRNEIFDPKAIRDALLGKLATTLREMAANTSGLRRMLDVLLVARPELLREAQKQAFATH